MAFIQATFWRLRSANSWSVMSQQGAVGTELVVVPAPSLYLLPDVLDRQKPVHVEAYIPETAAERLDEALSTGCRSGESFAERTICLDRSA